MVTKISVVVLTKNSSRYIKECLWALRSFDEVIILDNGSTDETVSIVKCFPNVKLYHSEFIGFGPLKNMAISKATHDWILSVDSDEILSQELVNEIAQLSCNPKYVYAILRNNYYQKKLIQCCGWGNDYVNRLFYRHDVRFTNQQVHESLLFKDEIKVQRLQYSMKHYSFETASELLEKMNRYSTLYAEEKQGTKASSLVQAIAKSLFAFIKNYVFQKGFLYGYEGFLISVSNANGVFYKYIKLMEINKK